MANVGALSQLNEELQHSAVDAKSVLSVSNAKVARCSQIQVLTLRASWPAEQDTVARGNRPWRAG